MNNSNWSLEIEHSIIRKLLFIRTYHNCIRKTHKKNSQNLNFSQLKSTMLLRELTSIDWR